MKRTGTSVDANGRLYRIGTDSIRCDPIALQIFDEFGSGWCSGPDASLAVHDLPSVFERYWEIDDYGGNETIRININEVLADILETFIESGDHISMLKQYNLACAAAGRTPVVFQSTNFGDEYDKNH
jgi:hypothetical protein